ncbi:hypothetical protein GUJ93_ZPchr0014g46538 [Zizania palustris]|uniref:Uncharacterized protein n=1 Tax=Zizania palustris TaxID=103762 RepID=A0A8J5T8R0_ZIZPA|nr:hypothetical protein GUJ93_ZPchr0014g46538 [Zizania palustris]KAG8083068.1 hypothetical protein GUJ93_ZPchr0014g46538 [Zizania palustris]KAG8083069.1 hypothetical protein GUJ93_ZPchr0014g46538 [Zizania palustris]KAG8083070.1 hypothetical protein GUJ93_ZPchr0014g46538 [Zizania palustris]
MGRPISRFSLLLSHSQYPSSLWKGAGPHGRPAATTTDSSLSSAGSSASPPSRGRVKITWSARPAPPHRLQPAAGWEGGRRRSWSRVLLPVS